MIRSPRLELVFVLTVDTIISFVCLLVFISVLGANLMSYNILPDVLDSDISKVLCFFAAMVGAVGVMLSATRITVAESIEERFIGCGTCKDGGSGSSTDDTDGSRTSEPSDKSS